MFENKYGKKYRNKLEEIKEKMEIFQKTKDRQLLESLLIDLELLKLYTNKK